MILQLSLAVTLTLLVSAFCSMAEAAFYSITRSYVEVLQKRRHPAGKRLQLIKEDMERYIASILILNTLANTFGVALATSAFSHIFPSSPAWIFALAMTVGILLFAEIIPKTLGVNYHRSLSVILSLPFLAIAKVFSWTGLLRLTRFLTRMLTGKKKHRPVFSRSELESIATLSAREGSIDPQQEEVIKNILRLKETTVRKIMTPRPVVFAVQKDIMARKSIETSGHWEFSRVPVYRKNKEDIVGMVMQRDIYAALAEGDDRPISSFLREVEFVPDNLGTDVLLRRFLASKSSLFIAVDEYGGMSGVVSLEDVLEEVLGREIMDEFDTAMDLQEKSRLQSRALHEIHKKDSKN